MTLAQASLMLLIQSPFAWVADWAWSLPLVVLIVVIHVAGLALLARGVAYVNVHLVRRFQPMTAFMLVVGGTALIATCLHGLEAIIWAIAFRLLGALPDFASAVLYSVNAMTSYGHTTLLLRNPWQLMGALEALNGWLLFGLTTAFLFALIQKHVSLVTHTDHTPIEQNKLAAPATWPAQQTGLEEFPHTKGSDNGGACS